MVRIAEPTVLSSDTVTGWPPLFVKISFNRIMVRSPWRLVKKDGGRLFIKLVGFSYRRDR